MKKIIEIECPDGYKPIYNVQTGKVEIVPENIMERIKTYEDAKEHLGYFCKGAIVYNDSARSIAKLQTILDALNEGHKFNLLTGTVWHPLVLFYKMKSVPNNAEVIGHFRYQGEKFALVGSGADYGRYAGLGSFSSGIGIGDAFSYVGMFACKSKEIAEYVSTQFGKLIFEACFARHFNKEEFEWIDQHLVLNVTQEIQIILEVTCLGMGIRLLDLLMKEQLQLQITVIQQGQLHLYVLIVI